MDAAGCCRGMRLKPPPTVPIAGCCGMPIVRVRIWYAGGGLRQLGRLRRLGVQGWIPVALDPHPPRAPPLCQPDQCWDAAVSRHRTQGAARL